MSRIVGIDLGTTHSLVATVDSGIPLVIADPNGRRLTPSVVYYPEPPAPPIVGTPARHARTAHPSRTVSSIKRFMGRRGHEVDPQERLLPYPLSTQPHHPVTLDFPERPLAPEDVSADILRKLKADAEAFLGEPVGRAVITVPAYFNDAQRQATKAAGERAGLQIERIVNEPTAAALAYGLNRLHEKARIAVYDLGGGTFDLSILELHGGVFQVLATHGHTRLGGDDIDQRVTTFLAQEIQRQGGPDVTAHPPLAARLREAAEMAKIALSSDLTTEVSLPFLTPSFSFHLTLHRAQLDALADDLIERTRAYCLRALADAHLEPADLDQVILVGGQTRMPLVRHRVAHWFQCADFEEARGGVRLGDQYHRPSGPQLNTSQNPDEAVALGAAIQAEILAGNFPQLLLLDVTPLSLGLETFGGLMNVLIPRNSTIPVKAGEVFTTAVDAQRSMLIHVLQGERERARDNWSLGRFTLDFAPAPKGVARVGVQFEIDANGILQVLARDLQTSRETTVQLQSAVDVDDAAVQHMVEESVQHAFGDLEARRWIETRLRAEETLAAARSGLLEAGPELSPDQQEAIQRAIADTENALATAPAQDQTGDLARLQHALTSLDETTRPLADLLMDRALETVLRQQGLLR